MGGAADVPHRSSSPLKRPASDLDERESSLKEDVDMIVVPNESKAARQAPATDAPVRPARSGRTVSISMLQEEEEEEEEGGSVTQAESIVTASSPKTDLPSIDFQINTVTTFCKTASEKQIIEGDKVYLVSKLWLGRVICRGTEARQKSKVEPEGEIGPVDNSDIIQQILVDANMENFVQLKHGVGMESFELFPEDAWNMILDWYGLMPGSIPIIRIAHNTNPNKSSGIPNVIYELHPPIFRIHRLWSDPASLVDVPLKSKDPDAPVFVFSRSTKYVDFLKQIKHAAKVPVDRKIHVWRVPKVQPAAEPMAPIVNTVTPPNSDSGSPGGPELHEVQETWQKLLLDVTTFLKVPKGEGREMIDKEDLSVNLNYNGSTDIGFYGLGDSQAIVIDESVNGTDYVSTYFPKLSKSSILATRNGALATQSNSQTNSGRNSPSPLGPMTRGRAQRNGRTPGTIGLSNLGNTCYMNSALQCIRSVEELTKYFLVGAANEEINRDNPLGNNGDVAEAYYNLLNEIYNTKQTSVAPRSFKATISRCAPSFSGYGQQDSQEFLGFLLDGLQEDLSRVKKKPYIEKPDSTDEMVNDQEAIREMAAKVWDITKRRDDSVIADLFTGMYKSTLVCPVCAKVSITFDPFNNLTLQLPIENSWTHQIYYFPLNDKPILITVDIDKQATILAMKHYLGKKVGVPAERLFVAEEFKSKFYKVLSDYDIASDEVGNNDTIAVYELEAKPTNWPDPSTEKSKKSKYSSSDAEETPSWNSPMADRMLVPVFYRRPNTERTRYGTKKPWEVSPVPHYIMLTPEEARSEDWIRRKILEKLATFTTHPDFQEDDEEEASESVAGSVDPDLVLTAGSESSGDSKVVATSIDGEDGLVDVTMKESSGLRESVEKDTSKSSDVEAPKPGLNFNKRRPKFLTPGSYLEPQFQNLFELGYFAGKELVPLGWNVVDEDKNYPRLSSRNPQVNQVADDNSEYDHDMTSGRATSETSNEEDITSHNNDFSNSTRTNEESSDEELALSRSRKLPVRPKSGFRVGQNKRRNRSKKTYSRKGNQPARKPPQTHNFDEDAQDDGPLIRLGEGIVVDWNPEAYNSMFGATQPDDSFQGQMTWHNVPQYHDEELAAKRSSRAQRRKNGITLEDCLNEFGKEEVLSEMDTWYCPRCKEHRRATKKFELWKTPDILVMHLKRFSSSAYRRDKLDVYVEFPIEDLDLTSRVVETEDGKSEVYDLFAVDDHWGGLGGGHYTAFAKNYVDEKWYEYNDSSVSEVKDISRIISSSAYLLFYRRRSEGMLGGPKIQEMITKFDKPETSEDDEADSGEGQSLVANSSLRGSSSALTGVGAALHQTSGSGTGQGLMMTVNPQDLDGLPAYQAHENEDDGVPLLQRDVEMNNNLGIQSSIEDEGIDLSTDTEYKSMLNQGSGFTAVNQDVFGNTWSLNGLNELNINARQHSFRISRRGSEVDCNDSPFDVDLDGSDVVQNNSSASEGSIRGRLEDFDNAVAETDDGVMFEDPSPVPDVEDENQIDNLALHRDLIRNHRGSTYATLPPEFQVHAPTEEVIDEPAVDIRVEEGEGLKMD